jgi:hypothetical protein
MLASTVAIGLLLLGSGTAMAQLSPGFSQGLQDRQGWETWFNGLTGDYQAGAFFWAGQRSLPRPAPCFAQGGRDLGPWTAGCVDAQHRLAITDVRRKGEPDYRTGWNAWTPETFANNEAAQAAREAATQAVREQAEANAAAIQRAANEQALADARAKAKVDHDAAEKQVRVDAENRAAAQLAAENAPNNRCREPAIAGGLMTEFNSFESVQDANIQSVDIEHLTTISFDTVQGKNVYACHGVFVLMNGRHVPGTLTTRLNVAGNVIVRFSTD